MPRMYLSRGHHAQTRTVTFKSTDSPLTCAQSIRQRIAHSHSPMSPPTRARLWQNRSLAGGAGCCTLTTYAYLQLSHGSHQHRRRRRRRAQQPDRRRHQCHGSGRGRGGAARCARGGQTRARAGAQPAVHLMMAAKGLQPQEDKCEGSAANVDA